MSLNIGVFLGSKLGNDNKTLDLIKKVYDSKGYVLDPHGAVGLLGLNKYLKINSEDMGVFLETANPIKFSKHVENILKIKLKKPEKINNILSKSKEFIDVEDYKDFKEKMLKL